MRSGPALLAAAAATAVLLAWWGISAAPAGMYGPFDPHAAAWPEQGREESRRWLRLEVPGDAGVPDFLAVHYLTAAHLVFRRYCGPGENLAETDVAGHHGELWVAAGNPPPREDPPCTEP